MFKRNKPISITLKEKSSSITSNFKRQQMIYCLLMNKPTKKGVNK